LGEELEPEESHYAYGRFADEMLRRMNDEAFFQPGREFISELADTHDSYLTEILVITVLQTVAFNPELSSKMNRCPGVAAKDVLQAVEQHFGQQKPRDRLDIRADFGNLRSDKRKHPTKSIF
jgi:hypothetical protein